MGYFVRYGAELLVTQPQTRAARAAWLHRFCAAAIKGMGVTLTVEREMPGRGAVISNHVGYLDIVAFASLRPCVFCSKAEIRRWPVLGWMTTMAGTVYVDRGRGGSALKAKDQMEAAYKDGLPVVFFPEGTTSNGQQVLEFHSGLLAQAMTVKMPVTAGAVRYQLDEDNGPDVSVQDDVCYWGEVNLLVHIWRFLSLRGVHGYVRFGDGPIAFTSDELHRKTAAVEARAAVCAVRDGGMEVRGIEAEAELLASPE